MHRALARKRSRVSVIYHRHLFHLWLFLGALALAVYVSIYLFFLRGMEELRERGRREGQGNSKASSPSRLLQAFVKSCRKAFRQTHHRFPYSLHMSRRSSPLNSQQSTWIPMSAGGMVKVSCSQAAKLVFEVQALSMPQTLPFWFMLRPLHLPLP